MLQVERLEDRCLADGTPVPPIVYDTTNGPALPPAHFGWNPHWTMPSGAFEGLGGWIRPARDGGMPGKPGIKPPVPSKPGLDLGAGPVGGVRPPDQLVLPGTKPPDQLILPPMMTIVPANQ